MANCPVRSNFCWINCTNYIPSISHDIPVKQFPNLGLCYLLAIEQFAMDNSWRQATLLAGNRWNFLPADSPAEAEPCFKPAVEIVG